MAGLPGEQEYTSIWSSAFEYDNFLIAGGTIESRKSRVKQKPALHRICKCTTTCQRRDFIKNPKPCDIEIIAAVTSFAASTIL